MAEQDHFAFLIAQNSHIIPVAYKTQYPDIQYPKLVPVDTSAPEWVRTITHFSMDQVGKAEPFSMRGESIPLADVNRSKYEVAIEQWGMGYDYTVEELNHAMALGIPLTADKAIAARRAVEEAIDDIVMKGRADYGWEGLIDNANITAVDAQQNEAGTSREWKDKTAVEILRDVNDALTGVYHEQANTVEMADTIALPPNIWGDFLHKVLPGTAVNVAQYIQQANVYTMKTGIPLTFVECRGLENAAAGNKGRMLVYRRDPEVLRLYMPMPFRFDAPQHWMYRFIVPGLLRLGGLEIRRPKAIRYVDGITS
jgi:hypothetical protein